MRLVVHLATFLLAIFVSLTSVITDASGQPVNTRTYAPFGELATHSGTGSTGLPTEDKGFKLEHQEAV